MRNVSPLDKQFYSIKKSHLQIPSAGRASLGKLVPKSQFVDGLDAV
jgi:hypothetical protein